MYIYIYTYIHNTHSTYALYLPHSIYHRIWTLCCGWASIWIWTHCVLYTYVYIYIHIHTHNTDSTYALYLQQDLDAVLWLGEYLDFDILFCIHIYIYKYTCI